MLSLRNSSVALTGLLALGLTSAAKAQFVIDAQPLDAQPGIGAAVSTLYTGIPGPYTAFGVGPGVLSFDDYVTTASTPTISLSTLRFVGGVGGAGQTINFSFFNPDTTFANGFNVTFANPGDFIYTITLSSALGAFPSAGFLQLTAPTGSTGRWFFTSTAPTTGSNSVTVGTGSGLAPQRNNAFELNGDPLVAVPEPGSVALMIGMTTLGGMLTLRRRRK